MASGLILGIESSCDETAAAVVRRGGEALSNVVASQMSLHANYGGVVPELASREHLKNIVTIVREAMARAGVSFADLDAVAVTEGRVWRALCLWASRTRRPWRLGWASR